MLKRQSIIHRRSSGSVTIFWLDRDALLSNLWHAARQTRLARPEVSKITLFGSAANGRAVPGSDADVLLVVRACNVRALDRPLPYLPFFDDVGVGVDLFVYSEQEMESGSITLARQAIETGKTLFSLGAAHP